MTRGCCQCIDALKSETKIYTFTSSNQSTSRPIISFYRALVGAILSPAAPNGSQFIIIALNPFAFTVSNVASIKLDRSVRGFPGVHEAHTTIELFYILLQQKKKEKPRTSSVIQADVSAISTSHPNRAQQDILSRR